MTALRDFEEVISRINDHLDYPTSGYEHETTISPHYRDIQKNGDELEYLESAENNTVDNRRLTTVQSSYSNLMHSSLSGSSNSSGTIISTSSPLTQNNQSPLSGPYHPTNTKTPPPSAAAGPTQMNQSHDLGSIGRHASMSSATDGRKNDECENCVHLQNQMLRFKEQVVVIRGNLGKRMATLENELREAVANERTANEKLLKLEEENEELKKHKSENDNADIPFRRFNSNMKQEMKQLYESQLVEKKRELESLELKLRETESKLLALTSKLTLNAKAASQEGAAAVTSINSGDASLSSKKVVGCEEAVDGNGRLKSSTSRIDSGTDEPDLAVQSPPLIPERPASTWRSSILQVQQTTGAKVNYNVNQNDDDYDVVHEEDRDVFFDTLNFSQDDIGSMMTHSNSLNPPERPVHKYPKWEEQVYTSIKNHGFNRQLNQSNVNLLFNSAAAAAISPLNANDLSSPNSSSSSSPVDFKNAIKFTQGMSTVCNEIDKSFDDKSQVVPLMYASVAGVAFQLKDSSSDIESRLASYCIHLDNDESSKQSSSELQQTSSLLTNNKPSAYNNNNSQHQQNNSSLSGFKFIGDDWDSTQADYCIPPDAIPDGVENRDYIKESDLDLILSKSSTMNSLDNNQMPPHSSSSSSAAAANTELFSSSTLQIVTEELTTNPESVPKAVLTKSYLSVPLMNKLLTFPLENIKSVTCAPHGNALVKLVFFDDYHCMLCCDSSKSCEKWVSEVNKALLHKPLNGQKISSDTSVVMKSWLCQVKNGHKVNVWTILSDNQVHFYASQKDRRPSQSVDLIGASLFEYTINENQSLESTDHSLLTIDNRYSDRSSSGVEGFPSSVKDMNGFMLVIAAPNSNPIFIISKTQEELTEWKYQCELCTGGGIPSSGTVFEQTISHLMKSPSDSPLWKTSLIVYEHSNREDKFDPLTSLSSPADVENAEKMWKLFLRCLKWKYDTRNNLQAAASDGYFVSQVQTAFQICLPEPTLHNEACCQLIRLCNTKDFPTYSVTAFQLLSLFVVLTQPKTAYLWLLKQFLSRVASAKTVEGKYALYCLRMLSLPRSSAHMKRSYTPSSLEVQSITQHNPHDVTQPMAVPVNLPDGATHYAGCDGRMTVDQFLHQLCLSLDMREPAICGYALYVCSPLSITPHHATPQPGGSANFVEYRLAPHLILSDVISRYEMIAKRHLASQGLTPTPTDILMRLHLKNRFSWRLLQQGETDRERLFSVYNYAAQISNSVVPVSRDLANYLTGLITFIELGEFNCHTFSKHTITIKISEIVKQYYPRVYLQLMDKSAMNLLCVSIQNYWSEITNARATPHDCIRTYLTAVRSWKLHDCKFFPLSRSKEKDSVVLAIGEVGIALLKIPSFEIIFFYSISSLLSFGSRRNKLFLTFNTEGNVKKFELMGTYSQVFESSSCIAEYINELNWLKRHVMEYTRSSDLSATMCNNNAVNLSCSSSGQPNVSTNSGNINKHDSLMLLRC